MKRFAKYTNLFRLLALWLALLCCSFTAFSQRYPIQVTATLTPPYSLRLSDYGRMGSQQLTVTIMVHDVTIDNLPVKLHIKMESTAGVTVETAPDIAIAPVYLSGGQMSLLFGADLADYFNINNLQFKGCSKADYQRTGQLPEGFYRFTVDVLHYGTNRVISNHGQAMAWIALGKPPQLKTPEEGAEVGLIAGTPLTFSWLPSNVGIPSAGVQYTFELWEQRLPGIAPEVIAASMPPLYATTQPHTALVVHPSSLFMEPGMRYAWRVTAADPMGQTPFEQDGHSLVRTFTYQSRCDSVTEFTAKRQGQRGTFRWTPGSNHSSFNVEVHNPATGYLRQSQSFDNQVTYAALDFGSTYRMRVQAVCNNDPQRTSDYTGWQTVTVPARKADTTSCPDCHCGESPAPPPITNFSLRKDLQPGDIISNAAGSTRFILKTVTPQSDGVYKGLLWFWMEIWNLKILCEYWDLSVNTDNVIVKVDYESVYNPQFLLDADAAKEYMDNLADAIAEVGTNTNIKDTLKLDVPLEGVYSDGEHIILVTVNPDGSLTETPLQVGGELDRTLIQGSDGEEYVVTSDGQVMGVDEFQATGGNSRLMDNYNEEKEAQAQPTVTFSASPNQQYGFDAYTEIKTNIQNEYTELKPSYRPAFKSVASYAADKVQTNGAGQGITFRDEMGLPPIGSGNELTVRGGAGGSNVALYAYRTKDSTEEIAGKLHILSFDRQVKKLYIISVNNAALPDAVTLQNELNKIYAPAVVSWSVAEGKKITVTFPEGQMRHGGSGAFSVYNADQKAVLKAFGAMDEEALYLFFVEKVTGKEGDYAGYMPLQYRGGFIYDNPGATIIAHELAHGAFTLEHTFGNKPFIAAQGATSNLMDYANGTELWKHQWLLISNPKNLWFKSWQDEEEGEANTSVHLALTPSGNLIDQFYILKEGKEENISVTLLVADSVFTIKYIKYNNERYEWDKTVKAYIHNNSKIIVKDDTEKPDKVNLFRRTGEACHYDYTVIDWTKEDEQAGDIQQTIVSRITASAKWESASFTQRDISCDNDFITNVLNRDKQCTPEDRENGYNLLQNSLNESDPEHVVNIINQVCLSSLRKLSYQEKITFFKKIAGQTTLKEYSELALLRLMNAFGTEEYKLFFSLLEEENNKLIKHLVAQMHDVSIYFWIDGNNYTHFIGALVYMYSQSTMYLERISNATDEALLGQIFNLTPQPFQWDFDIAPSIILSLNECRYRGIYNEATGKIRVQREIRVMVSGISMWTTESNSEHQFDELSPLAPIIVSAKGDLPLVQTALGEGIGATSDLGTLYVVPAIFLKYQGDKEFNEAIESAAIITLDAVTIAGSGGVALATKVHWARRIWAMAEVAGAIGDIAVNTQTIDLNSDLGQAVNAYNLAMGIIGVKNLGKGIANFAKELPEQTKNLLKENKGLRSLLIDYKTIFKSKVSRSKAYGEFDDLDDISKQKINEQEKVFDDLLKETNVTPVYFSQQQIDDYVRNATKNGNKDKVLLGKYDDDRPTSYKQRAMKEDGGYIYFDLDEDSWGEAFNIVKDNDEMWKINKKFIDNNRNKEFFFSHDPRLEKRSFLKKEYEYLIELGGKRDLTKINDNLWKIEF